MNENDTIEEIVLADIRLDRDTQVRASVDEETVRRYYEVMVDEAARDRFPPILLFRDENGRLWLADGHHRITAALRRGFRTILAVIRQGTKEDAIWEAIKANSRNGLPLGRADIRRAIEMVVIAMPEKSTTCIAENLGCSQSLVANIKNQLTTNGKLALPERTIGKDGKCRPSTRKIKSAKPKSSPDTASTSPPVAKETTSTPNTLPSINDATVAKTGRGEEPMLPATERTSEETNSDDRRRIEANVKRTQIETTITQLEIQLGEWFDVAPDDMHEGFDRDIGNRLRALCR